MIVSCVYMMMFITISPITLCRSRQAMLNVPLHDHCDDDERCVCVCLPCFSFTLSLLRAVGAHGATRLNSLRVFLFSLSLSLSLSLCRSPRQRLGSLRLLLLQHEEGGAGREEEKSGERKIPRAYNGLVCLCESRKGEAGEAKQG